MYCKISMNETAKYVSVQDRTSFVFSFVQIHGKRGEAERESVTHNLLVIAKYPYSAGYLTPNSALNLRRIQKAGSIGQLCGVW